jgi:hypothetical protein
VDSAGKREVVPASCRFGLCLFPTPRRGDLTGPIRAISRGFHHACALDRAGAAYCWGDPALLGTFQPLLDTLDGRPTHVRGPAAVAGGLRFRTITAGGGVTCGITLLRQLLFCWGGAGRGLDLDSARTVACRSVRSPACGIILPRQMLPESLPGARARPADVRFAAVDVGYSLVCAASTEGLVFCWGNNQRCVLGRCRMESPGIGLWIPVPGRVVEVGAGNTHACARTADGRIFCWGDNTVGQLGSLVSLNAGPDGLPPDYTKPSPDPRTGYWDDPCFQGGRCSPAAVEVGPGRKWSSLAVGGDHACALETQDQAISCWGGSSHAVVGSPDAMVDCINRSPEIPDRKCAASPTRIHLVSPRFVGSIPVHPVSIESWRGPTADTKVEVTRHELRVIFPADSSLEWGWPPVTADFRGGTYSWSVEVNGMDGPVYVNLVLHHTDSTARSFPSQESVVEAASAGLCRAGMVFSCRYELVQALVENGSVVLRLRDSATIARLFGLRQNRVVARGVTPLDTDWVPGDSVAVHYVDPRSRCRTRQP